MEQASSTGGWPALVGSRRRTAVLLRPSRSFATITELMDCALQIRRCCRLSHIADGCLF
jgi:hypothetical protein